MRETQGIRWSLGKEYASSLVRTLFGVMLFILVIGIWVYLWVPPVSLF
jgi:hypothetical protein